MKKDFGDSINNKVYEFRVLARLSQKELADKIGVSKQTIFVMEKGKYIPIKNFIQSLILNRQPRLNDGN